MYNYILENASLNAARRWIQARKRKPIKYLTPTINVRANSNLHQSMHAEQFHFSRHHLFPSAKQTQLINLSEKLIVTYDWPYMLFPILVWAIAGRCT